MRNSSVFRFTSISGLILIITLLALAYFLQIHKGINPCPLCLLQRLIMGLLGIIFLAGIIIPFKRRWQILWGIVGLLIGISGVLLSSRQVWLQVSPPHSLGDCSASLSYIFNALSLPDAIKQIWQGGMECSQMGWEFLHLSLAAWSLISFSGLCLLFIILLLRVTTD
ncbi:MAG: dsbB 2 [Gammaproteobacteria bacterium]|jgi:disulfide bond formation protein DsbB|nr:dsbB 2 [Gammaproteobacteria bacterium]MCE3237503.1 dsbB 2 [Gammaproteobacteria bacterium]